MINTLCWLAICRNLIRQRNAAWASIKVRDSHIAQMLAHVDCLEEQVKCMRETQLKYAAVAHGPAKVGIDLKTAGQIELYAR